jgi:hypothetical protein
VNNAGDTSAAVANKYYLIFLSKHGIDTVGRDFSALSRRFYALLRKLKGQGYKTKKALKFKAFFSSWTATSGYRTWMRPTFWPLKNLWKNIC